MKEIDPEVLLMKKNFYLAKINNDMHPFGVIYML